MAREYALPDGTTTRSGKHYVAAWREKYEAIAQILGVETIGFDPDILVIKEHSSIELPKWLFNRIIELGQSESRMNKLEEALAPLARAAECQSDGTGDEAILWAMYDTKAIDGVAISITVGDARRALALLGREPDKEQNG